MHLLSTSWEPLETASLLEEELLAAAAMMSERVTTAMTARLIVRVVTVIVPRAQL